MAFRKTEDDAKVLVKAFGSEKTAGEWSDDPICVVSAQIIVARLKRNWDAERAITAPYKGRDKLPPHKPRKSMYKGVSYHTPSARWRAQIREGDRVRHIGYFNNEVKAAKRYDEEAKKLYGVDAKLNFS